MAVRNVSRDEPQSAAYAALKKADITEHEAPVDSYPPISSIQQTCITRLFKAAKDEDTKPADTVLYLAYGSNMSAQTFLGMRKIRPLSEINVVVPSLKLSFDLPGIAYREPCFANVQFRDKSEAAKVTRESLEKEWDGSLMGVVYEVTKPDWARIMGTEGGGTSYQEIVVPCIPLPSADSQTDASKLPQIIKARTLYAPRLPEDEDPSKRTLWEKLSTGPYRPDGEYAQASERYLKLLRVGAREHQMPQVYQDYLNGLQHYAVTSRAQKIGAFLFMLAWGPVILAFVKLSGSFADENGRIPKSLGLVITVLFNMAWISYDYVYKPAFGDGERTQGEEDEEKQETKMEEKPSLLD